MNTAAWSYGNGTSSIAATCDGGTWTFSGTVGVSNDEGANAAGFGFALMGYVHDTTADADVDCSAFDLSAYTGLSISLASASGAISTVGIGVDLAGGGKGEKKISVSETATEVTLTWSDLGISDALQIKGIWGYFVNGEADVTVDLVIDKFGPQQ